MAPPKDRYIGRDILNGQFKILKKIGTGGMGSVYKASQPEMNRLVAVKILHAKLKDRKDLVSRFRREARAMSHLEHPNTVKVMMYGELDDGELYIVMEYLEGKNLNQIVRREGPMPVERAVPVLMQVCGALEEAHELGIIHRDLKPENIFLTNRAGVADFAKVLDFGLAKVTERELRPGSIMLTQEGMVFGTPEFMSPEQAQGEVLDRRSDLYSLANILYEALTGKLPFEARTSMEYIQLHVMKPPIPLDERIAGKTFPPGLGDIIAKALAKNPDDRWPTVAAFGEALRPYAPPEALSGMLGPALSRQSPRTEQVAAATSPATTDGINAPVPPEGQVRPDAETIEVSHGHARKDEAAQSAATADTDPATPDKGGQPPAAHALLVQPQAPGGLSSRTLILVSAVSVIVGIVFALVALRLLG